MKIWPDVRPGLDAALRQAEQALSKEPRAAAQAAGAAMSPEEAIEFALEEPVTPASGGYEPSG